MTTTTISEAKHRALRLLARRDHSLLELRTKLRQKIKIDDETFNTVVIFLKNMGYLADENDLANRCVLQWRREGRGRHWISGKLKTKGLPLPTLRDDDDEMASALVFLGKKTDPEKIRRLPPPEKARVARSMISRGFSSSIVATLLK